MRIVGSNPVLAVHDLDRSGSLVHARAGMRENRPQLIHNSDERTTKVAEAFGDASAAVNRLRVRGLTARAGRLHSPGRRPKPVHLSEAGREVAKTPPIQALGHSS